MESSVDSVDGGYEELRTECGDEGWLDGWIAGRWLVRGPKSGGDEVGSLAGGLWLDWSSGHDGGWFECPR